MKGFNFTLKLKKICVELFAHSSNSRVSGLQQLRIGIFQSPRVLPVEPNI
jgi:hypothetical protein